MKNQRNKRMAWWEYGLFPVASLYFFIRGHAPLMGVSLILSCFLMYYLRKNRGK